jgi:hypothetical protein
MIFYIMLYLLGFIFVIITGVFCFSLLAIRLDLESRILSTLTTLIVGGVFGIIPALIVLGCWIGHSSNLAKISHQEQIISVQVERIDSLTKRMQGFEFPPGALLNADTPVAAIVSAINDSETKVAEAKTERAEAIRAIERTRLGPFSGVIDFVGDYKVEL